MAGGAGGGQRWATFEQNHAEAIVACDFFVAVSDSRFHVLYVFAVKEVDSQRIFHVNVTDHPAVQ